MRESTIRVTAGGQLYNVAFTFEWHNPLLPGNPNKGEKYPVSEHRIKQTTTCTINLVHDDGAFEEVVGIGKRQCSVVDRYNYMKGVRESLHVALVEGINNGDLLPGVALALGREVLPAAAAEYREYRDSRKPSRPGVKAYRRIALKQCDDLEAIARITEIGVEAFVDEVIEKRRLKAEADADRELLSKGV